MPLIIESSFELEHEGGKFQFCLSLFSCDKIIHRIFGSHHVVLPQVLGAYEIIAQTCSMIFHF